MRKEMVLAMGVLVVAAVTTAGCATSAVADEVGAGNAAAQAMAAWRVPNWMTIVTEPEAVQRWTGKMWCGHCQGMCVSSNAIYFSFHNQIVKTDWWGRLLKRIEVQRHGGDICHYNGRLYTGLALVEEGGKASPWIVMYDADTLEEIKRRKVGPAGGCDGITALDGVVYLAMGRTGTFDPVTKRGNMNRYCKFDAETLEPLCEPFLVDDGEMSVCGSQNMTTDGKYIYSSHYTYDERERTPNVVVHDKDTFKVLARRRFGWNQGLDFVPGGKDGALRFAWCFTPNWTGCDKKDPRLNLCAIVQFVDVKDGEVHDITEHGGGLKKYIDR